MEVSLDLPLSEGGDTEQKNERSYCGSPKFRSASRAKNPNIWAPHSSIRHPPIACELEEKSGWRCAFQCSCINCWKRVDVRIPHCIRRHLKFYRIHLAYFLILSTVGAIILWVSHRGNPNVPEISVVNAIMNAVSVSTATGITSVRMSDFTLFDDWVLLILMTLGSPVFTSLLPIWVRMYYFHRYHQQHLTSGTKELETERKLFPIPEFSITDRIATLEDVTMERKPEESRIRHQIVSDLPEHDITDDERPTGAGAVHFAARSGGRHSLGTASDDCEGLKANGIHHTFEILGASRPESTTDRTPLSIDGIVEKGEKMAESTMGVRNAIEHQSLVALCGLVPAYMILTQLIAFAVTNLYVAVTPRAQAVLKERDINTVFFSFFSSISAFTNSGVSLHDDNLIPFQSSPSLLLLYTLASLMGNLLYPLFIRMIISSLHWNASSDKKSVYRYLLVYPRRCYTHLFPARQTVWLLLTLVGFTVFQLVFFCALDWHSKALAGVDPVSKIVDGVYQSVSVRNSGGSVVVIGDLSPTMLVLYVYMMYVAVYPIFLLRQNSAQYEETDMAIFRKQWEAGESSGNSLTFQSRKLLAHDSVYLCIILFTICIIEGKPIREDPLNFSIFNIIFEVVSAYGGVGMSVGYSCAKRLAQGEQPLPACEDVPYSFSGKWSPMGRLILAVVMLMGRQRGLPDEIDSAIKLPSIHWNDPPVPTASGAPTPHSWPPLHPNASPECPRSWD